MSKERARKALRGEKTDRIPIIDTPAHPDFIQKLTGIDPFAHTEEAVLKAIQILDPDILSCGVPEQTRSKRGDPNLYNLDQMGFWRHRGNMHRDIMNYDPRVYRGEGGRLTEDQLLDIIMARLRREAFLVGDCTLSMGFTFTTCIHYAAEDLDWESWLIECMTNEDEIDTVLDRFEAASHVIMRAHARAPIEVMWSHDDIAMKGSLVLNPDWMRKHVFPRYQRLWAPLKKAGVPVLFFSDGNHHAVSKDLVAAGADGFFLDAPCMDLERLVADCGPNLIYFTGPSPATLTVGTPRQVRDEMKRLAGIARSLPRFFWHMPGGFTHDMPVANVQAFYDAVLEDGAR